MKNQIFFLFLSFIVFSCNTKKKNSTIKLNESQIYKRVMGNKSWGFVDQKGDTIIPLSKYKFLNPIDEEEMILAMNNGKSGYINIQQDTLIPFKYDDLGMFSNGLAPAKLNGKYGFINRKGKVIIPFKYETESYFYKCNLAKVRKNNKYGFIDKVGNIIVPLKYENVRDNQADEFVCVMKNGKWAFFSCEGEQLTKFEYNQITSSRFSETSYTYFEKGLCRVQKNGKFGYINSSFENIIPYGKFDISETYQNDYAIVAKNGKYGIIDTLGTLILPLKYKLILHPKEYSNQSELFVIKENEKYQLLDKNTKPITKFNITEYEWDSYQDKEIYHRQFILKNDIGFVGTIAEEGKSQIPFNYQEIVPFDSKSITIAKQNGKYGLIDYNNKIIYPFENNQILTSRFFDLFIVDKAGKIGVINKNGENIISFSYENISPCHYDKNKRFIVKKNEKYGVIDNNENIIIPIEYDEISNWVEYGPNEHFITKNGKKGLISREGEIVIPPMYDEIFVDNSKLIKVFKNGKFGTIDWKNKTIHPIEYENILWEWPFISDKSLDIIYLKKKGQYFSTDTKGKIIEKKVSKKRIKEKVGYLLSK